MPRARRSVAKLRENPRRRLTETIQRNRVRVELVSPGGHSGITLARIEPLGLDYLALSTDVPAGAGGPGLAAGALTATGVTVVVELPDTACVCPAALVNC